MRGSAALLLCLVLGSCAAQPPAQVPASSTSTTGTTTSTTTDTTTPSIPPPLPPSSAPLTTTPSRALEPGATTTVRGTVSAGVESGCVILTTNGEQYLLLGADPAVAVTGAVVEVSGRADPGAMTTCQQGTPFHVTRTQRG